MLVIGATMSSYRWSKEEIQFLVDNFAKIGTIECAKKLDRTNNAIYLKAKKLALRPNFDIRYNRPNTPNGYTYCFNCKQQLPESDFYRKTKYGKYGKKGDMCRSCSRTKARTFYSPHKHLEKSRKSPEKMMLSNAKTRAKLRNLEINIDLTDIVIPEYCPILGIKITPFSNNGHSPSLDRINNTKGYIKGNVHVISRRANMLKSDSDFNDIKKLYDWYLANQ